MCFASCKRAPAAFDLETRSLPARSTKFSCADGEGGETGVSFVAWPRWLPFLRPPPWPA